MLHSFACPGCGKEYELPWSMVGKKARCKGCREEFTIPPPVEPSDPRTMMAIPIRPRVIEPPPISFPVLNAPPRSSIPPPSREDAPEPPRPRQSPSRPAPAPSRPGPVIPRAVRRPEPPPPPPRPARPSWLIPAIAGGGLAAILALNVGLFFLFGPKADLAERIEPGPGRVEAVAPAPAPADVAPAPALGEIAKPVVPAAPPGPIVPPKAAEPARKPVVPAAPPEETVPDGPMSTADIVAKYEPSVALIKGKKGSGTGFVARAGIVATNAHVIDGERMKDVEVRFPSAEETKQGPYAARLLFQDRERDLALLGVVCDLPPVRVAEAYRFRKGEDVTVIGNPGVGGQLILENAISRGIVSSMTKLNQQSFIQLGIAINPGNSGGPVFDPRGRVIGIVTLKTTKQEGLAFAIPAEDLRSALDVAQATASSQPTDPSQPGALAASVSNAPTLVYAWKPGQTYAYSFEIELGDGSPGVALKGASIYRVKAVDADGITLGHHGWVVTTRKGKDGKVPPGGVSGPTATKEVELKIDPQGNVLKASGAAQLPLLGDLSMLIIEPFPDEPRAAWDDSKTITLQEIQQTPGEAGVGPRLGRPGADSLPTGPRSRLGSRPGSPSSRLRSRQPQPQPRAQPRPQVTVTVTSREAGEETAYTLGEVQGDRVPIRKDYELATKETVGDEPRLKMTGEGTISFDIKAGIPLAMDYKVEVIEISGNTRLRLPIAVSCRLLEGKDREKALRPPAQAPSAMNPIEAGDLNKLLADLKSPDTGRRRAACQALFNAAPIEGRRADVARAIERLVPDRDMGLRGDAVRALGVWGDARSADTIIETLRDESFGVRDELFEALSRLSPTEKAAEAVVPWLAKENGRAAKALRAIGPPAEGPLIRQVEAGTDLKLRTEACRLLKDVGTSQSVPALERLAGQKQDGEVGRDAEEAVKNIARRWPGDDEWTALLGQARSPDGGKRREAADRISKAEPVEARRGEVARILEALAGDVDGGTQSMAFRALGTWGDERSRAILIGRLADPDLRPVREAMEALGKLGPDEQAARAIASRASKDRRIAVEALTSMGPVAEDAALLALNDAGRDVFLRNDLIRLLGKIGTDASLPALREAAGKRDGGEAQKALKEVEARTKGPDALALLPELKSADGNRRRDALRAIASLPRDAAKAPQAARALDPLWDIDDGSMKKPLREAVVRWGDDRSADALAERLARPDFRQWEEALTALAGLRPDARTAGLLAARLGQNQGVVIAAASTMPFEAERPLLAIAKNEGDPKARADACRALGAIGTRASLPDLQALAGRAGDAQLAREADDALKAIASRQ